MAQHKTGQTSVDPYYLEGPFQLGADGIDTYNPPLVAATLAYLTLQNVDVRLNRILSSSGFDQFQPGFLAAGDTIMGFGMYAKTNRRYYDFYAFSKTSIYQFDFSVGKFKTAPIFTGFPSNNLPYVCLPWYDEMFVTKLGGPYVRVQSTSATIVVGGPSARYGIIANSHGFLGAVNDSTTFLTAYYARLRWSDLDAPDSYDLDPTSSEADFFDLEPDARQITGLSYQRGVAVQYAENAIWNASYIGFPGGFKLAPLFTGIGNIFHDAVVRTKEIDYFIGVDNFYSLNGLQIIPIGDKMFERFINDVVIVDNTSVRGYLDSKKYQVFWVYNSISHGGLWSVVYNYAESKWSERDPQNMLSWFDSPKTVVRGYEVIDTQTQTIDSDTDLIKDPNAGFPLVLPQFMGNQSVYKYSAVTLLGGNVIETFDFYGGNFNFVKETTKVMIEWTGLGNPQLSMQVCSRHNQMEAVVYGDPILGENIDGTLTFFSRDQAVGKFLRFKFTWTNTITEFVTDLRLLAFDKVDSTPEEPADK